MHRTPKKFLSMGCKVLPIVLSRDVPLLKFIFFSRSEFLFGHLVGIWWAFSELRRNLIHKVISVDKN